MPKHESTLPPNREPASGFNRREVVLGLGALASAAYAGSTTSAMPGHDHSKHAGNCPICSTL